MRLFQNSGTYPAYLPRLNRLSSTASTFVERRSVFLADRFGASHFLKPVLDGDPSAFFTNGDDEILQRLWARENGLPRKVSLENILLAQIEAHCTEVFYNVDPIRYPSTFVKRLPATVRRSIAWRAAPALGADFSAYDLVVCNFHNILEGYRQSGWNTAWFTPAHDPAMDALARERERPIDVLFVGGYTRHHRRRAELLEAVAALNPLHRVVMHLDLSRATRLAESFPAWVSPLKKLRRSDAIRAVWEPAVFGVDLYRTLSQAKIVLNCAIDMAGSERGNMRCFESMGCGALLVSDAGSYPDGMADGETMVTFKDPCQAVALIQERIADPLGSAAIAAAGHAMICERYSKELQWDQFVALCS